MTNTYVYGVLEDTDAAGLEPLNGGGLGPVRTLSSGGLTALCSDATGEVMGRRRELAAHADLLATVCQQVPVVPLTFGTVLPDDDAVRVELLERLGDHLHAELRRLAGVVQFAVTVRLERDVVLGDIVRGDPRLAQLNERVKRLPPGSGQAERLRLGEAVAAAYERAAGSIGDSVVGELARSAVDRAQEQPVDQDGTTALALLVDRGQVKRFLSQAGQVAEGLAGRAVLRVVGPLPPYSFLAPMPEPTARSSGAWD